MISILKSKLMIIPSVFHGCSHLCEKNHPLVWGDGLLSSEKWQVRMKLGDGRWRQAHRHGGVGGAKVYAHGTRVLLIVL
jgi:hypothetical protein